MQWSNGFSMSIEYSGGGPQKSRYCLLASHGVKTGLPHNELDNDTCIGYKVLYRVTKRLGYDRLVEALKIVSLLDLHTGTAFEAHDKVHKAMCRGGFYGRVRKDK